MKTALPRHDGRFLEHVSLCRSKWTIENIAAARGHVLAYTVASEGDSRRRDNPQTIVGMLVSSSARETGYSNTKSNSARITSINAWRQDNGVGSNGFVEGHLAQRALLKDRSACYAVGDRSDLKSG